MAQAYRAPKIHTKVIFTVPTFAKEDQRRRWWCSRPECCWSATADQDLKRHYKECHRHFVDAHEKVFAAEQATWVNAKYIDSRHAGDEEQHVVRTMARRKPRARLITKTQVVVEEGEGQGQLFKVRLQHPSHYSRFCILSLKWSSKTSNIAGMFFLACVLYCLCRLARLSVEGIEDHLSVWPSLCGSIALDLDLARREKSPLEYFVR